MGCIERLRGGKGGCLFRYISIDKMDMHTVES